MELAHFACVRVHLFTCVCLFVCAVLKNVMQFSFQAAQASVMMMMAANSDEGQSQIIL